MLGDITHSSIPHPDFNRGKLNRLLYDMDLEENLELPLTQLQIRDGTILRVVSDDHGQIDLVLQQK